MDAEHVETVARSLAASLWRRTILSLTIGGGAATLVGLGGCFPSFGSCHAGCGEEGVTAIYLGFCPPDGMTLNLCDYRLRGECPGIRRVCNAACVASQLFNDGCQCVAGV